MGVFVKLATMALAAVATSALADPPGLIRAMDQAAAKHHGKSGAAASSSTTAVPVQGDAPGVTRRLEHANDHALDAQGHKLDAAGRPVGQAPTPALTSSGR